jgi:SlyX protein
MQDERLIDLEIKFAHQERELEELRKALFEQGQELAKLEKSLKLMKERLDASGVGTAAPVNEKPPHY